MRSSAPSVAAPPRAAFLEQLGGPAPRPARAAAALPRSAANVAAPKSTEPRSHVDVGSLAPAAGASVNQRYCHDATPDSCSHRSRRSLALRGAGLQLLTTGTGPRSKVLLFANMEANRCRLPAVVCLTPSSCLNARTNRGGTVVADPVPIGFCVRLGALPPSARLAFDCES